MLLCHMEALLRKCSVTTTRLQGKYELRGSLHSLLILACPGASNPGVAKAGAGDNGFCIYESSMEAFIDR